MGLTSTERSVIMMEAARFDCGNKGTKDASLYQDAQRSLQGSAERKHLQRLCSVLQCGGAVRTRSGRARNGVVRSTVPAVHEQDEANNNLDCVTSARDERLRTPILERSFHTKEHNSSMGLAVSKLSAPRSRNCTIHTCLSRSATSHISQPPIMYLYGCRWWASSSCTWF
jgi:hypothetical protein